MINKQKTEHMKLVWDLWVHIIIHTVYFCFFLTVYEQKIKGTVNKNETGQM